MSEIEKPINGSEEDSEKLDDELAAFTDELLEGNIKPEEAETNLSEDEALRDMQKMVLRMHQAFGSEEPDPAVSSRMKLELVTEMRKMAAEEAEKSASIGTRMLAFFSGFGRGRQFNALLPIAAVAAVFLFVFIFVVSDGKLDNLLGSSLEGYPIPNRMEEVTPLFGLSMRVSVNSNGVEVDNDSWYSAISADGRYVAFVSASDNLVENDTNGMRDIFVHDQNTGYTERISLGTNGQEANGDSLNPAISADGRFVAFESQADNLANSDTNNTRDIFVRDRQLETTELISIVDGQAANAESRHPAISADGRFVAFYSTASDLAANDNNGVGDVFLFDRQGGVMTTVSLTSSGQTGDGESRSPAVSEDGQYVAFESVATDLAANDHNNASDIFLYSRQDGSLQRISVNAANEEGDGPSYDPDLSADGRYVAFESQAENLWENDSNHKSDIFVYFRGDNSQVQIERASVADGGGQANDNSGSPSISSDGRYVTYSSFANNLTGGEVFGTYLDVYVFDRDSNVTERISADELGQEPEGASVNPDISADGRFISFDSTANNLVSDDFNGRVDVFIRDRMPPVNMSINYQSGSPGSYFTISGTHFQPDSIVSLVVNGVELGTVPSDAAGNFTALLATESADAGGYVLRAATGTLNGSVAFMLDPNSAERIQETDGTIFNIPAGIAYTHFNSMPAVLAN
ncbi:MAG: hypothetical protein WAM60_19795 [Candidatus Promineifilaceae bacterium]